VFGPFYAFYIKNITQVTKRCKIWYSLNCPRYFLLPVDSECSLWHSQRPITGSHLEPDKHLHTYTL